MATGKPVDRLTGPLRWNKHDAWYYHTHLARRVAMTSSPIMPHQTVHPHSMRSECFPNQPASGTIRSKKLRPGTPLLLSSNRRARAFHGSNFVRWGAPLHSMSSGHRTALDLSPGDGQALQDGGHGAGPRCAVPRVWHQPSVPSRSPAGATAARAVRRSVLTSSSGFMKLRAAIRPESPASRTAVSGTTSSGV